MPWEQIVHAPHCATRRHTGCTCSPQVILVANPQDAEKVKEASEGDSTRVERGRFLPPVHVNTIHVARSQAARHRGEISN